MRLKTNLKNKKKILYRTKKIKVRQAQFKLLSWLQGSSVDERPQKFEAPHFKSKFIFCLLLSMLWFLLCAFNSMAWVEDLGSYISPILAYFVVVTIALIPGFMNMFLLSSFIVDDRKTYFVETHYPDVSVLIAAYNEEDCIIDTIKSLRRQEYPGKIEILLIDDGSTDQTITYAKSVICHNLTVLQANHQGKACALNLGLEQAKYDYVVTVDADTILDPQALFELMQRLIRSSKNTVACAGAVYVKNDATSLMSRLQFWDYFLAISIIKRSQSFLQGTLVAQGAFSAYKKSALLEIGGWPSVVGEDIVMTWSLLDQGYQVGYAESAFAFTSAPENYKKFFLQRTRWARGLVEAFKKHKKILLKKSYPTFFIYWNLLFIVIDLVHFIILVPSVIASLFGYYLIFGPLVLVLVVISVLNNAVFFIRQRKLFERFGYLIKNNMFSFILYTIIYQYLMNPAVVYGYYQEFLKKNKTWGTK